MMFDDARIGHQAMELSPVSTGGVHAQHILTRPRRLAVDLISNAAEGHGHVAAGYGGHRAGAFPRMQRHRHRQRTAQCQPFPDLEQPPHDMSVLHKRELVTLDGEFRQPIHHSEDAVMMTWRNRLEKEKWLAL